MKTLADYKTEFLTPENAKEYAQTQDKFLFVEYLTDLSSESRILQALDLSFWNYCIEHNLIKGN